MGSTEQGSDTMNTDTTIAKNIRVADEEASYDLPWERGGFGYGFIKIVEGIILKKSRKVSFGGRNS